MDIFIFKKEKFKKMHYRESYTMRNPTIRNRNTLAANNGNVTLNLVMKNVGNRNLPFLAFKDIHELVTIKSSMFSIQND